MNKFIIKTKDKQEFEFLDDKFYWTVDHGALYVKTKDLNNRTHLYLPIENLYMIYVMKL